MSDGLDMSYYKDNSTVCHRSDDKCKKCGDFLFIYKLSKKTHCNTCSHLAVEKKKTTDHIESRMIDWEKARLKVEAQIKESQEKKNKYNRTAEGRY